jgi:nucleoside-diphosphate-sugar epimerase
VYASSIAAYGFHADNPVGIKEDWPTRPADTLFYAQEKAELEKLLAEEAEHAPDLDVYVLRPPIVLGPNAVGGKVSLPGWVTAAASAIPKRLPPLPIPVPDLPIQFIHQDDVASALLRCVLAEGPPGAYNIAADETLTTSEIVKLFGGIPVPLPAGAAHAAARAAARVPGLPQPAQWIETLAHPAVMDTTKARDELGWIPRVSARDALLETLRG